MKVRTPTVMFDAQMSRIIKGIAIVLMLIHHFYTFPVGVFTEGVTTYETFANIFCVPTRICVSLFAFLTGWAFARHADQSLRYTLRKVVTFLLNYWLVYVLVLTALVLSGTFEVPAKKILLEMFGLTTPIMLFCWYTAFYIVALPLLSLISRWLNRNILTGALVGYVMVFVVAKVCAQCTHGTVIRPIFAYLAEWFPCVCSGYLMARYALMERILCPAFTRMHLDHKPVYMLLFFAVMFSRGVLHNILGFSMDAIYAPLAIFALVQIFEPISDSIALRPLEFLGIHATNIWFLHSIFFLSDLPFLQRIAYLPGNPILVILWVLVMCTTASIGIHFLLNALLCAFGLRSRQQ